MICFPVGGKKFRLGKKDLEEALLARDFHLP